MIAKDAKYFLQGRDENKGVLVKSRETIKLGTDEAQLIKNREIYEENHVCWFSGSGKTTLTQRLKGLDIEYFKTQAVQFHDSIIDTPGEFLQHRRYYNALTVTAAEAEIIGLLIAGNSTMQTFPQGFSSLFTQDVIGIISKIDLVDSEEQLEFGA